jgi:hypothetical protein
MRTACSCGPVPVNTDAFVASCNNADSTSSLAPQHNDRLQRVCLPSCDQVPPRVSFTAMALQPVGYNGIDDNATTWRTGDIGGTSDGRNVVHGRKTDTRRAIDVLLASRQQSGFGITALTAYRAASL